MKKILIVDDEFLVRVGIRSITNWEEHGYSIIGEAENGKEALSLIEKLCPNIVLTDLKMDPVNGMEVMRQSAKLYPQVKFVVLSSYNDFDNVKTAMKLGAVDYIFKLSITETELLKILDEIQFEEISDKESLSYENKEIMKTKILHKIIDRDLLLSEDIGLELTQLDERLKLDGYYQCMLIDVDNFFQISQADDASSTRLLKVAMLNISSEVCSERLDAVVFDYDNTQLLALIPCSSREDRLKEINACFATLYEYMKRYLGVTISGAVTECFFGIERMSKYYTTLLRNRNLRFWKEKDYSNLLPPVNSNDAKTALPSLTALREYLLSYDLTRAREQLHEVFAQLYKSNVSLDIARGKILELYGILCSCETSRLGGETNFRAHDISLYTIVTKADRLYDIETAVYEFLNQYEQYLRAQGKMVKPEVLSAKQYVKEHLSDDLSVQTIAGYINMNESYFSHLFKKETGGNFTDYVLEKRISRAKELLLQSNLSIGEISETVGIDNPNYFSNLFKKATGKSPTELRKNHQH